MGGELRQQANWLFAVLLGAMLLIAGPIRGEDLQISGIAKVIDGDTIEIRGVCIRLFGIDALEGAQNCGRPEGTRWDCVQQVTFPLAGYPRNRTVVCVRCVVDRYGPLVCRCTVSDVDVNAWLVTNGWVVAYKGLRTFDINPREQQPQGHRALPRSLRHRA